MTDKRTKVNKRAKTGSEDSQREALANAPSGVPQERPQSGFGCARGLIHLAPDSDAPLDEVPEGDQVETCRDDGQEFDIQPVKQPPSSFDVRGAGLDLTAAEIVSVVQEVRSR